MSGIFDPPGTSAPFPFNPSGTAVPTVSTPTPAYVSTPTPPPAVVQLAETPPEMIRWALGLVTPNELASALGVKEGTLTVWRSSGDGPGFIKLGKHVFYRLDDLSQWVWSKHPQKMNKHPDHYFGHCSEPMAGVDDAETDLTPYAGAGKESPWMQTDLEEAIAEKERVQVTGL